MKHGFKSLALLALLPTSSAFANLTCVNGLHSLTVNDKDPTAVEVALGLGRAALTFKGAQTVSEDLEIMGSLTYSLESQNGEPALLHVTTSYPILNVYGCGRRICFPEDGEKPTPQVPNTPKISANLEVGAENKVVYDFKLCSQDEPGL